MDKSYISIKDLSKKFNENKIINNLSIEIDKGDLVKISGKNGSGKTTFLKIFSQLYTFDEGNIFIKGQPINKNSYLKSIISYCSSDSIFYKDLSVKNNIIFYFNILGESNPKDFYEKNNNFLEINTFEEKFPEELSNGQKKRMNLFRTLIPSFEIYLLDEPELGLDSDSLEILNQKLVKINNLEKTIFFSTHNLSSLDIYNNFKKEILL